MDASMAATLVRLLCANVDRPWPYKTGAAFTGPSDLAPPRQQTPIFYGCFDWHSAVHSHWALARLLRAYPSSSWARDTAALLDARLSPAAIEGERQFLLHRPGFEQPYGVAWLVTLCTELERHAPLAARCRALANLATSTFMAWLARLPGPIRSGQHDQTAFAMSLVFDSALAAGDDATQRALADRARELYAADRDAPIDYEPSAHDFLSPALSEAALMARVLDQGAFASWLQGFLPEPRLQPVASVAPSDGKLAHAAGLNISRAWMAARIASALGPGPLRSRFEELASAHAANSWCPDREAPYAETHWLPTFVVYHHLSAIS